MVGSRCDTVDPMRACRLLITAVRHVVEAYGADGLWQSEMRQQNQNSQNEPGMSFRINETEKRGGEERRLNPHSKLRPVALSHSPPTCYAVIGELRRGRIACIMLQARGLFFKARGIRENSRGTKPADRGAGETRTALTRQGSPGEGRVVAKTQTRQAKPRREFLICFAGLCGSAPLREVVGFPMRAKTKPSCLIPPQIGPAALIQIIR